MAIYNGGILDEYKNKVGNVVGRRWRGLDVISKYQPNVSNPNTPAQQEQRMKFGALSELAKAFRIPLGISMAGVAAGSKNPVRGQFMSRNVEAIEVVLPDTVSVDYTSLKVAEGGYIEAEFGNLDLTTALTVKVPFTYNIISGVNSGNDKVHIVVYNREAGLALEAEASANAGSVTFTAPASWNGAEIHVWGYVVAEAAGNRPTSPSQVSPSYYIGNGSIS